MIYAGTALADVTPAGQVWMEGMIREHQSEGVHDRLRACALVLGNAPEPAQACAIVSIDVCILSDSDTDTIRSSVASSCGIPAANIVVACTHTHSGPSTAGIFQPKEVEYTRDLCRTAAEVVCRACSGMKAVNLGTGSGENHLVSNYRRLMGKNGKVIMNWEPYEDSDIDRVLGEPDPEVGVLKVVDKQDGRVLCTLFNHSGHPNVMSGENYLISADYAGAAYRTVEENLGGQAIFLNGAQGTMDIDPIKYRDWEGVQILGSSLAESVMEAASRIMVDDTASVRAKHKRYTIPRRHVPDEEWNWARDILEATGGKLVPQADGVGDEYVALVVKESRDFAGQDVAVEQTCIAIGDTAFISFPGELYTEIGQQIKKQSPFARTYVIGLANGSVGYVPTRKAIAEGGYAESTRRLHDDAEDLVVANSLRLLKELH